MWKGAEPDVEVFIVRHPESKANVEDANYGNTTPLSEKGLKQLPFITEHASKFDINCIMSSEADRAVLPVLDISLQHGLLAKKMNPFFNEFRRPRWTVGKSNKDPDVAEALRRRINDFGPGYEVMDGEESFTETAQIIQAGLDHILEVARSEDFRRILLLTHGLRARQIYSWIFAAGDRDFFAKLFKATYRLGGYENCGFMHIWHGYPFRETEKCWNIELADSSHIPPELQ